MNFFLSRIFPRLRWFNLSGALLIALLQRTPVLRLLGLAERTVHASPAGALLKSAVAALGALGAAHTLAGATQLIVTATTVNGTVGTPVTTVAFSTTGAPSAAGSYSFTGTFPPGVAVPGASGGILNNLNGIITGTPTAAGTFTVSITAWEFANKQGSSEGPATVRYVIAGGAGTVAPQITAQPQTQTAATGATVTFTTTVTGTPTPTLQWRKDGANLTGATSATLTLTNVTVANSGIYTLVATNSAGTATTANASLTVTAPTGPPSISAQPQSQTTAVSQRVTLTVTATGNPAPTYQWFKNGVAIANATAASFTIDRVALTDAGNYTVAVTNSQGTVNSAAATLNVDATASAPSFAAQPASQTVAPGSTVAFNAPATGTPTPTYQWLRNGAALPGASASLLVVKNATAADAATYTCVVTNTINGTRNEITSAAAVLTLTPTTNPGRLINLSIITPLVAGEQMSMGTVLGGAGTSGAKAVLARAVGPSLGAFGVPGTLPDPKMTLVATGTTNVNIATNDNWAGDATLSNAFAQVGAFAYANGATRDAAVFQPALAAGNYAVQVSDATTTASGTILAEIYDATPAANFTAATPRLINVSVIKTIATGSTLSAGFVIGGATARTVLVRALGPGLGAFGVPGVMPDPKLDLLLQSTGLSIASNDNWGGATALVEASSAVGAFAIANAASTDAVLLVTLAPGSYAARVQPAAT
ncbi:MAG: hypothetical protein RLZZ15_807, partial [Verrucomicrobiota bacterium]